MKRTLALGITATLIGAALSLGASPAVATEGAPCVPVAAYTETITPASDETVIDTPAQEATYKTQYQFEHAPNGRYMTRWEDDANWNANDNANSTGWRSTGVTQEVEVTAAVEEVSHVVHHDAVTVDHPAVTCPPVDVPPTTDVPVVDVPAVVDAPTAVRPVADKPATTMTPVAAVLPDTGAPSTTLAAIGALLLILGAIVTALSLKGRNS